MESILRLFVEDLEVVSRHIGEALVNLRLTRTMPPAEVGHNLCVQATFF
jgi:hypothetical protein